MTLWLVLYNIELENQGFKVDNFCVFISLVSTKEERRAAFKKAKNNLKAKADAGDTGAQNKLKGFNIDKMNVWTGPQHMGAFPTIKVHPRFRRVAFVSLEFYRMRTTQR